MICRNWIGNGVWGERLDIICILFNYFGSIYECLLCVYICFNN